MSDTRSRRTRLRVPFGGHNGRMVSPDKVERGLACQCKCPGCGQALVANQGPQKRDYFSHHHDDECAGGYESAVHEMAKQLIVEHSRLTLPRHTVGVKTLLADGTPLHDEVIFRARSSILFEAREETGVNKWRPDVVATLKNGASLHIEVLVTHGVEPDKAAGIDNLMEIDLSDVAPDSAGDVETLREIVINRAPRYWYRVSLYDDLGQVHRKHRQLEAKAAQVNARLRDKQARDKQQRHERMQEIERERERLGEHLRTLEDMGNPVAQQRRRETMREQWARTIEQSRLNLTAFCQHHELPVNRVGVALEGDWIVQAPPDVWQFYLLSTMPRSFRIKDQVSALRTRFGFDPVIVALDVAGAAPRRTHSKVNTGTLTEEQRQALTTPHELVRRFLDWLIEADFLEKASDGRHYQIVDKQWRDERQAAKKNQQQRAQQLSERINSLEQRRYCENMLESFLSQGVKEVSECLRCWALTQSRRGQCRRCGGQALADTQLTDERVEQYRQKIASLGQ